MVTRWLVLVCAAMHTGSAENHPGSGRRQCPSQLGRDSAGPVKKCGRIWPIHGLPWQDRQAGGRGICQPPSSSMRTRSSASSASLRFGSSSGRTQVPAATVIAAPA